MEIKGPMFCYFCPLTTGHVCVGAKLYWFIISEEDPDIPGKILSVDWEENFRTVNLPYKVTGRSFLIDLHGFPTLVSVDDTEIFIDIWQLQNDDKSWLLKASASFECFGLGNIHGFDSVAARGDGIFFVIKEGTLDSHRYLMYNVALETWREFYAFELDSPFVISFSESLLQFKY